MKLGEIFQSNQVALKDLRTFGQSWGMLESNKALVFVDNHDNQRGHGGAGTVITYKNSRVSFYTGNQERISVEQYLHGIVVDIEGLCTKAMFYLGNKTPSFFFKLCKAMQRIMYRI